MDDNRKRSSNVNIKCKAVQHQSEENAFIVFGYLVYFRTCFGQIAHFRITQKTAKLAEKLNLSLHYVKVFVVPDGLLHTLYIASQGDVTVAATKWNVVCE